VCVQRPFLEYRSQCLGQTLRPFRYARLRLHEVLANLNAGMRKALRLCMMIDRKIGRMPARIGLVIAYDDILQCGKVLDQS